MVVKKHRSEQTSCIGFRLSLVIPQKKYVINVKEIAMQNWMVQRWNEN